MPIDVFWENMYVSDWLLETLGNAALRRCHLKNKNFGQGKIGKHTLQRIKKYI
jgi:hypothetical protein